MNKRIPLQDYALYFMKAGLFPLLIVTALASIVNATTLKGQEILDVKITLDVKDQTIGDILSEIEKQTKCNFTYRGAEIGSRERASLTVRNVELRTALRTLFNGRVTYEVNGNEILLIPADDSSGSKGQGAQSKVTHGDPADEVAVSGKVTDENSEPLPGASVIEMGTTNGTVTDSEGNFSITVAEGTTLLVSFVGYTSQKVTVDGLRKIFVQLQPDFQGLDEVVVVGYGVQEKVNLTGAVATVSAKEIENRPIASLEEALQGSVPGLNMVRTGGQPGNQAVSIRIRGTSTFTNNPALIVVDGIPTTGNILDQLNPNDIESISVLKDAASASIYGSRATGGVILITTKTGKKGQPKISVNSSFSIQSPTRFPEKVSALDHALLSNEARLNDGGSVKYSDEDILRFSSPEWEDYDWDDQMFINAPQTSHTVSISGGNETGNYFASFGYLNQEGVVVNSGYERINIQLNHNIQATKWIDVGYKLGFIPSTRSQSPNLGSILNDIHVMPKTDRFKSDAGQWVTTPFGTGLRSNPLAMASADAGEQVVEGHQFTGSVSLNLKITDDLKLTGIYGQIRNQTRDRSYYSVLKLYDLVNPDIVAVQNEYNSLNVDHTTNVLQNFNALLNYDKSLGNHHLTLLGGFTAEWFEEVNDVVGTRDFLTDNIYTLNAGSSDPTLWSVGGGASDWALASFISRATYSLMDKYLFEASMRFDGSSRFAEGLKWGLFPSVSAGWILSQEDFLKDNDFLTFLKIRSSWGRVGNQNVGFYPFANTLSQSSYYFGGTPHRAVSSGGAPNPILTWETKESVNFGLEGSILANILEFSLDVFQEKTHDILLLLPLPRTFGLAEPVQNAGRVDNRGWELELRHRNNIGDFDYGVSFQVSDATNEVIDMGGVSPRISESTITEEGRPMNEWFGLKADGFFQNNDEVASHAFQKALTSPGDIRFVDVNGDDVINSDDRVRLGRSDPRFPYGMRINASYRNFDFSVFGQGVMSHQVWSSGWTAINFERENSTLRTYHLDRWTPETPDARFPKTRFGSGTARSGINDGFSSFWLENAAYFRLKNIQLGYNVPQHFLQRIKVERAKIYFSAENLITWTKYLGYDPEMATGTGSNTVQGRYPLAKVYSLGLNLNF